MWNIVKHKLIEKQLSGFPIVLHGSSSVPQDEVDTINKFGGLHKVPSGKGMILVLSADGVGTIVGCVKKAPCLREFLV